jgi:hypothetical protein
MKKILILFVTMCVLAACESETEPEVAITQQTPAEVVEEFYFSLQNKKTQRAFELFSPKVGDRVSSRPGLKKKAVGIVIAAESYMAKDSE